MSDGHAPAATGSTEGAGSLKPVLPPGPRITQNAYLTKSSPLVDLRLKVFWPKEGDWFYGRVTRVRPRDLNTLYTIVYDDDDVEEGQFIGNFKKWVPCEYDDDLDELVVEEPKKVKWLDSQKGVVGRPAWSDGCSTPTAAQAEALWDRIAPEDLGSSSSSEEELSQRSGSTSSSSAAEEEGGDAAATATAAAAHKQGRKRPLLGQDVAADGRGPPSKMARGQSAGNHHHRQQQQQQRLKQAAALGGNEGGRQAANGAAPSPPGKQRPQQQEQRRPGLLQQRAKQQQQGARPPGLVSRPAGLTAGIRPPSGEGTSKQAAVGADAKPAAAARLPQQAGAAAGDSLLPPPVKLQQGNGATASSAEFNQAAARLKAKHDNLVSGRPKTQMLDQPVAAFAGVKQRGPSSSSTPGPAPSTGAAAGALAKGAAAGAARPGAISSASGKGGTGGWAAKAAGTAAAVGLGMGRAGSAAGQVRPGAIAAGRGGGGAAGADATKPASGAADGSAAAAGGGGDAEDATGVGPQAAPAGNDASAAAAAANPATTSGAAMPSQTKGVPKPTKIGAAARSLALSAASKRVKAESAVSEALAGLGGGKQAIHKKCCELLSLLGPLGGAKPLMARMAEHMDKLPEGALRLHLLYVMDALLARAHKALSGGVEAAASGGGQEEVGLSAADAKELVAKAGYAAKLMVPKAAYDPDSIGKVKRLLNVWTDKQRIDTIYLKEANLKLQEAESVVSAQQEAAAKSRAQAAAAAARAAARRAPRISGCYMAAPARCVCEADILGPAPPLVHALKQEGSGAAQKMTDMGLEDEASLASLVEEAEEMEAAQLAALQQEQAARDARPRWVNLFGPEVVGRPARAWEYDSFGKADHPCQGLLAGAGLVLRFMGLLLEEELPWEVTSRGGEPLELKGTWKHVLEPVDQAAAAAEQSKLQEAAQAAQAASAAARLASGVPDPAQLAAAVAGVMQQGQYSASSTGTAVGQGSQIAGEEAEWGEGEQPVSGGWGEEEDWEPPAAPQRTVREDEQYEQYTWDGRYWEGQQDTSPAFNPQVGGGSQAAAAVGYSQQQQLQQQQAYAMMLQQQQQQLMYAQQQQQQQHMYAQQQQQGVFGQHMAGAMYQQQYQQHQMQQAAAAAAAPPLPPEEDEDYLPDPPLPEGDPPPVPPSSDERTPPLPDDAPPPVPLTMDDFDDEEGLPPLPAGPPPPIPTLDGGSPGDVHMDVEGGQEQSPLPPLPPPPVGQPSQPLHVLQHQQQQQRQRQVPGMPHMQRHLPGPPPPALPPHLHTPGGGAGQHLQLPPHLQQQQPRVVAATPQLPLPPGGAVHPGGAPYTPGGVTPGGVSYSGPHGMYAPSPAAAVQHMQQHPHQPHHSMGTPGGLAGNLAAAAVGGVRAGAPSAQGWGMSGVRPPPGMPLGAGGTPGGGAGAWTPAAAAQQQQMQWHAHQQQQMAFAAAGGGPGGPAGLPRPPAVAGAAGMGMGMGGMPVYPAGFGPGAMMMGAQQHQQQQQLLGQGEEEEEQQPPEPMDDQLLAQQMGLSMD